MHPARCLANVVAYETVFTYRRSITLANEQRFVVCTSVNVMNVRWKNLKKKSGNIENHHILLKYQKVQ